MPEERTNRNILNPLISIFYEMFHEYLSIILVIRSINRLEDNLILYLQQRFEYPSKIVY